MMVRPGDTHSRREYQDDDGGEDGDFDGAGADSNERW